MEIVKHDKVLNKENFKKFFERETEYDKKIKKKNEENKKELVKERNGKTIDIMSYLLECFNIPDAVKRRDGDPQIEQLAHFILGKYSFSKEEIIIIDVGAGYGDLIKAINSSGIVSKISYIPIEIDRGKWEEIENRCKSIDKLKYSSPSDRNIL